VQDCFEVVAAVSVWKYNFSADDEFFGEVIIQGNELVELMDDKFAMVKSFKLHMNSALSTGFDYYLDQGVNGFTNSLHC
jgi:hypothetical protein